MTGPPPPIKKRKKFSLSPSPQNPKKGKNWLHWLHTKPSSVPAWNFYYGPIPLHNRMDTYCAINRAEWVIRWNSGVLQFKKGSRLPLFALDGWRDRWMTGYQLQYHIQLQYQQHYGHVQNPKHFLSSPRMMGRMRMEDGTDGWKGRPPKDDKTSNIIYIDTL